MLKIKVALRVFSNSYTLAKIFQALGEFDKGFSMGDSYGNSGKKREATLWSKTISLSETDTLEAHIREAISFLNLNSKNLTAIKRECNFDLFCMLSTDNGQGGTSLKPSVLRDLYTYGVGLTFDVYSGE